MGEFEPHYSHYLYKSAFIHYLNNSIQQIYTTKFFACDSFTGSYPWQFIMLKGCQPGALGQSYTKLSGLVEAYS